LFGTRFQCSHCSFVFLMFKKWIACLLLSSNKVLLKFSHCTLECIEDMMTCMVEIPHFRVLLLALHQIITMALWSLLGLLDVAHGIVSFLSLLRMKICCWWLLGFSPPEMQICSQLLLWFDIFHEVAFSFTQHIEYSYIIIVGR